MTAPALAILDTTTGTIAPGVGTVTPGTSSDLLESLELALLASARASVHVPPPAVPAATPRLLGSVSLSVTEPIVARGIPYLPAYRAALPSAVTTQMGTGHIRTFTDPDPVWGGSAWTVAPPDAPVGSHFLRWTVRDLPNPASYGGSYKLGTLSAADGTSGLPASAAQWNASGGSSYSIPWQSNYPFKPTVRAHTHYGPDGSMVTQTAGVFFNPEFVEHMWADFGTIFNQPFTFLIVGIVLSAPSKYGFYLLDAGQDQTPNIPASQRLSMLISGVTSDIAVSENFGYRTAIQVLTSELRGWNEQNPTTRIARTSFANNYKPKMFFGIWNGNSSLFGNYYYRGKAERSIKLLNLGAQRLTVLGRRNGLITSIQASSMVVFEIRAWDAALTSAQLDAQYAQLSSTWLFDRYK